MKKNKRKSRFMNRGVYFVSHGEYKGCFLLNLKELDTVDSKFLSVFPEGNGTTMKKDQIGEYFEKGYLEYVRTIPRKVYKVCLGQHTKGVVK